MSERESNPEEGRFDYLKKRTPNINIGSWDVDLGVYVGGGGDTPEDAGPGGDGFGIPQAIPVSDIAGGFAVGHFGADPRDLWGPNPGSTEWGDGGGFRSGPRGDGMVLGLLRTGGRHDLTRESAGITGPCLGSLGVAVSSGDHGGVRPVAGRG